MVVFLQHRSTPVWNVDPKNVLQLDLARNGWRYPGFARPLAGKESS
jgi:hypothetical protein